MTRQPQAALLRCDFCDKDQNNVKKLIVGYRAYICDECVILSMDIVTGPRVMERGDLYPEGA